MKACRLHGGAFFSHPVPLFTCGDPLRNVMRHKPSLAIPPAAILGVRSVQGLGCFGILGSRDAVMVNELVTNDVKRVRHARIVMRADAMNIFHSKDGP